MTQQIMKAAGPEAMSKIWMAIGEQIAAQMQAQMSARDPFGISVRAPLQGTWATGWVCHHNHGRSQVGAIVRRAKGREIVPRRGGS